MSPMVLELATVITCLPIPRPNWRLVACICSVHTKPWTISTHFCHGVNICIYLLLHSKWKDVGGNSPNETSTFPLSRALIRLPALRIYRWSDERQSCPLSILKFTANFSLSLSLFLTLSFFYGACEPSLLKVKLSRREFVFKRCSQSLFTLGALGLPVSLRSWTMNISQCLYSKYLFIKYLFNHESHCLPSWPTLC